MAVSVSVNDLPEINGIPQSQSQQSRLELVLERFLSNTALANEVECGPLSKLNRTGLIVEQVREKRTTYQPVVSSTCSVLHAFTHEVQMLY